MPVTDHAVPFHREGKPDPRGSRVGVLLSHGFTGSPASMTPWGDYLAERGYAVAVPRLPGHGTTWQEMNRTTYADWYGEVEREFEALAARCDHVVVGGLSMGGALALQLAARHPDAVVGVMLVNAAVSSQNRQLLAVPALKWVVPALKAIGDDIKKPGVTEHAYQKTPLRAVHSMMRGWAETRADLPKVRQPILLWRSREDHVVDPQAAKDIQSGVSSTDVREVVLENSYHVATLDHDAPLIFETSAEFIERVTA